MSIDKRLCPMCGEEIAAAAKKCKHCGEFLDGSSASPAPPVPTPLPIPSPANEPQEKAEGMIFCRGCGKKLHCSAVACPHCGAAQNPAAGESESKKSTEGVLWIPIVSMILGIVCALACFDESEWDTDTVIGCSSSAVAGLVLGIVCLCKQKRGRGMAITGIVLSALSLLIYIGSMCK